MNDFLIFYAPILFVIISILFAFWIALKDDAAR